MPFFKDSYLVNKIVSVFSFAPKRSNIGPSKTFTVHVDMTFTSGNRKFIAAGGLVFCVIY